MSTAVVNTATYIESEQLLDGDLNPVTTKVNGDWTKSARLKGVGTTVTPTITHASGGVYDISATFTAIGEWDVRYSVVVDGITRRFGQTVKVITAAQADPNAASGLTEARAAKLDLIGTGRQVVVTSPVSADAETLTLVQGDDYSVASGQPVEFTEPSDGPSWPTLTGATPRLVITNRVNASVIDDTGTVEVATGSSKRVQFELTAAQTGALRVGNPAYTFAVIVTLASGAGDRTLIRGDVVVERDSRP